MSISINNAHTNHVPTPQQQLEKLVADIKEKIIDQQFFFEAYTDQQFTVSTEEPQHIGAQAQPTFGAQPVGPRPTFGAQPAGPQPTFGAQPTGSQLVGPRPTFGAQPVGPRPIFGAQIIGPGGRRPRFGAPPTHFPLFCIGSYYMWYPGSNNKENKMWKFVAFMNNWLGLNIDSYLKNMKDNEDVALRYFLDWRGDYYRSTDRSNFLEYLMVSSCFLCFAIILFQKELHGTEILKGTRRGGTSYPVAQRIHQFSVLTREMMTNKVVTKVDMLHIANQIPWLAVEAVFTNSDLNKLCKTSIDRLAISCFDDIYPRVNKSKVQEGTFPSSGFKDLLHIFHWTRTPQHKFLVDPLVRPAKSISDFYIPSATELVGSATDFMKTDGGFCDAAYENKTLSGLMQIANLHILAYSSVLYSHLLEFEQKNKEVGLPITAYIACMESLLQTKADVELLQMNGIVKNTLKDEKEVLDFVCDLRIKLEELDACIPNDLTILSMNVMEHHKKSISREYSQFKNRYCPNRWVVISVMAAFALFVLTFLQTVYTIIGYYKT